MPSSKVAASSLRNPELASEGQMKIEWVARHMPLLAHLRRQFIDRQPFAGQRIAICIHMEAKSAWMALTFAAAGAEVHCCASNPLSTRDDICAALAAQGVTVHAWYGAAPAEYSEHIRRTITARPTLIIDDGGDLVSMLHTQRPDLLPNVLGGAEETTTGLQRLYAMAADGALRFPMLAVNNARMKHLFDNRYGTGQSVWDGIMRTTNLSVAGKTVAVAGYGWCGKGVTRRAQGLGANVIVTEVDPVLANEAMMDGHRVMPMLKAAAAADLIVTTTGCYGVVRREHFEVIKDGCILANAGHFDVEILKPDLERLTDGGRRVRQNITEYRFPDGRRVYVLADGLLVNIAAGDGHPAEIMDMSFAVQFLTLQYIAEQAHSLNRNRVIPVPAAIDNMVANLRLEALGVEIDRLSAAQEQYLSSWQSH